MKKHNTTYGKLPVTISSLIIMGILLCFISLISNAQNNFKSFNQDIPVDTTIAMEIDSTDNSYSNYEKQYNYDEDSLGDVYSVVQSEPHFPGGQQAYYEYLNNNFVYPKQSIDNEVQGIVWVIFIVEKDGSVTHAHIIPGKGLDQYCNAEVLRIINTMPKWKPGMNNGKPVRTKHKLGVTFELVSRRALKKK